MDSGQVTGGGWQLIAIWDANGRGYGTGNQGWEYWEEASEWALAHGGDIDTHRYEIWLMDCPVARIFRYKLSEHGRRYIDLANGEPAQQPVRTEILSELPPPHLRVSADA